VTDRDSVRLAAAIAVLERGFGKPLQREEHGKPGAFEKRSKEEIERSILEKGASCNCRSVREGPMADDDTHGPTLRLLEQWLLTILQRRRQGRDVAVPSERHVTDPDAARRSQALL